MKNITQAALSRIIERLGIMDKREEIISTLMVSLDRQKHLLRKNKVELDRSNKNDIQELLRIGADISPNEARDFVAELQKIIERDPEKSGLIKGDKKTEIEVTRGND